MPPGAGPAWPPHAPDPACVSVGDDEMVGGHGDGVAGAPVSPSRRDRKRTSRRLAADSRQSATGQRQSAADDSESPAADRGHRTAGQPRHNKRVRRKGGQASPDHRATGLGLELRGAVDPAAPGDAESFGFVNRRPLDSARDGVLDHPITTTSPSNWAALSPDAASTVAALPGQATYMPPNLAATVSPPSFTDPYYPPPSFPPTAASPSSTATALRDEQSAWGPPSHLGRLAAPSRVPDQTLDPRFHAQPTQSLGDFQGLYSSVVPSLADDNYHGASAHVAAAYGRPHQTAPAQHYLNNHIQHASTLGWEGHSELGTRPPSDVWPRESLSGGLYLHHYPFSMSSTPQAAHSVDAYRPSDGSWPQLPPEGSTKPESAGPADAFDAEPGPTTGSAYAVGAHDVSSSRESSGAEDAVGLESTEGVSGETADSVLPIRQNSSRERRRRSAFDENKRQQTSKTRGMGACIRCKMQRIRCNPNPDHDDPDKGPCATCLGVSQTSKKVIHHIPCRRWKVIDTTWFRPGRLGLTKRWNGTAMKDVNDWTDESLHTVEVKVLYGIEGQHVDLCDVPLRLMVRKFKPMDGDVLVRKWTRSINGESVSMDEELAPYALADVSATATYLKKFFDVNTIPTLSGPFRSSEPVVQATFRAAVDYYGDLPENHQERQLLGKLFAMWFAMRYTTGSAYISGQDKLGMTSVPDPDYPLGDKISLPRMVTAQLDSIVVEKFLKPLSKEVLPQLENFFKSCNPKHWFILYLSTFILVHEAAFSSFDRWRHARQNFVKERYSIGDFVQKLQEGANVVLIHWHYYKTTAHMDPSDVSLDELAATDGLVLVSSKRGKKAPKPDDDEKVVTLSQQRSKVVVSSWNQMKEREPEMQDMRAKQQWEHPLFFASQMYMKEWRLHETYSAWA